MAASASGGPLLPIGGWQRRERERTIGTRLMRARARLRELLVVSRSEGDGAS